MWLSGIRYLKMAKTSIRECVVLTTIAYQANFLSETYEQESRQFLMELTKMSGALISSLQRAQNAQGNYNGNYHGNGSESGNAYNNDAESSQEETDYNYNRDN